MRVNEIFHSLQGEGFHAGRAAVFVRFSGCNLRCPFCDTEFEGFREMTEEEIVAEATRLSRGGLVVLTGGEPTLQMTPSLTQKLREAGFTVCVETNGTRDVNHDLADWITCSPKQPFLPEAAVRLTEADEVKVVFDGVHDVSDCGIKTTRRYVQPCDVGEAVRNAEIAAETVEYVKKNPQWQLSVQLHKLLGFR